MSYSDFTLESVQRLLGVGAHAADLFPDLQPVAAPLWLQELLTRGTQGIKLSLISEKSRSEFIVAPILLASREVTNDGFAIYSGQRLDVDPVLGLVGECDFVLTAAEAVLPLQAPIATVVEAKKNDIEACLGQCIAQMVAAEKFNRSARRRGLPIFGCVTTGEAWQFARLVANQARLDNRRFYIDRIDLILGMFQAIVKECRASAVAENKPAPALAS